jgi:hypothetical protein
MARSTQRAGCFEGRLKVLVPRETKKTFIMKVVLGGKKLTVTGSEFRMFIESAR